VPVPRPIIPAGYEAAPDGGVYESSPASTALAEHIARIIAAKGGTALIMDYGYAEVAGFSETLQAVSGHRFAEALYDPGQDDISAHVDFAALAAAGKRGGAAVFGPATQGLFLANIGITERAEQLMKANPDSSRDLLTATERLIGNDQMGVLFKALAFAPPSISDMAGFAP